MKKIEKQFLDNYNNLFDSNVSYGKISNRINVRKYQNKPEGRFSVKTYKLILMGSLCVLMIVFLGFSHFLNNNDPVDDVPPISDGGDNTGDENNNSTGGNTGGNTPGGNVNKPDGNTDENNPSGIVDGINYSSYDDYIKYQFESEIGVGPYYVTTGPRPYYTIEDLLVKNYEFGVTNGFNYIYEVKYREHDLNSNYIGVYIEEELATKIYTETSDVCGATPSSPLNVVNGSIVDWFYSYSYYNKEKVQWYQFASENLIPSKINEYICVGVYKQQQRVITKEIITNTDVNYIDDIYSKLQFKNENNDYLTPLNYQLDNSIKWYVSYDLLTDTNYDKLFIEDYNLKLDATIDLVNNLISIETYAVQSDTELSKVSDETLYNFYIETNNIVVSKENNYDEYGLKKIITYNYNEYVELLKQFKE